MELLSILDTKILMQPAIGYVWNENFMFMVFASSFQYKINVQSLKHHQLYLLVGEPRWHLGIIMQVLNQTLHTNKQLLNAPHNLAS
jgi:hypothetical protein